MKCAQAKNPNGKTPVVCLTANAISGARETYLAAGFDDYLSKPINSGKLEDMLIAYLPKDKIVLSKEESSDASPADKQGQSIPEVLMPLMEQDSINVELGIKNSGSVEAYLPLLKIFYTSIDGKAKEIMEFYEVEDWKNYTIKVHALKSSARIIGAVLFGEEAQELENAGKREDVAYIKEHQETFMRQYMEFKPALSELFAEEEKVSDQPEADAELMANAYGEIRSAAEDMDCDRLENIFAEMADYRIPANEEILWNKLKEASDQYDYSAIMELLA